MKVTWGHYVKRLLLGCYVASVVSDSVQPCRRQRTRLHRPSDSPGKNTGVGCHFLLQCMKEKVKWLSRDPMDCSPPGSSIHGVFQAKEYWSGVPLPSPLIGLFSDYYLFPYFLYIFVSVSIVCVSVLLMLSCFSHVADSL